MSLRRVIGLTFFVVMLGCICSAEAVSESEKAANNGGPLNEAARLPAGSRVDVTGVAQLSSGPAMAQPQLNLLLGSLADVAVISAPRWWDGPGGKAVLWLWGILLVALGIAGLLARRLSGQRSMLLERERELEARYQEWFENPGDMVFTLDLDGQFLAVNKTAESMTGYKQSELLRMKMDQLTVARCREIPEQMLAHLRGGESREVGELEIISKLDERHVLQLELRGVFEGGRLTQAKGVARDLTGRKRSEEGILQNELQLRHSLVERERIGRDLHDGIIRSIDAVGLSLEDSRRLVKENPAEADKRLARARETLNEVIREVRGFIGGLEAQTLTGREFKTALRSLILTMGDAHSAQFILDVDPHAADALTSAQATQLLFVAKEAMSNSLRHARAQSTVVSLKTQNGSLRLEVKDDGVGFDPNADRQQGRGLRNMAARAEELRGRLEVKARPQEGTRIVLEIPRGLHESD